MRSERSHCFSNYSLRNLIIKIISLVVFGLTAPGLQADDPENCLFCHQYRGLSYFNRTNNISHVFFVQPEYVHQRLGPHAVISCTGCHERSEVSVVPHLPVSKVDCARNCHLGKPGALEQRFSHRLVADMLQQGVHTQEILTQVTQTKTNLLAAGQSSCLYCHDEPVFRDPTGFIPLLKELGQRTFDRCDVCHERQAPADTAYYLRHMTARLQPARPTLEMAQVCAVCHSDRTLCKKFKMHDAVGSYVRSYHGKAALLGDQTTASCLSCHIAPGANVHLMLKKDNPASSVSSARVADTCRNTACHPGADAPLGAAGVHLDLSTLRNTFQASMKKEPLATRIRVRLHEIFGAMEFWVAAAFILLTIATFGPSMVICILELLPQVIGWKHHHDQRMDQLTRRVMAHPEGRRRLIRFTIAQRIQHWILAGLFGLLVVTGFPLKFADQEWSSVVINSLGGLNHARLLHHWGGFLLVFGLGAHAIYILWTMGLKRKQDQQAGNPRGLIHSVTSLPLWIGPRDMLDFVHLLAHLLHLRAERPSFGRFSIKEKFEYIGVFWGTVLLGVTGFLLWGQEFASYYVSGRVMNFALIAHTFEAFLAIIHVGILHLVNVMLSPNVFPLSRATLTGETPLAELSEGHSDQVLEVAQELGLATDPERQQA
jgi:cytochrome b subunit of formate dehydrogenase